MTDKAYLTGRTAMITGGVSGMGRAIALALAANGANVSIGSLLAKSSPTTTEGEIVFCPNTSLAEATKKEIETLGVGALAMDLDVCSNESIQAFYDATVDAFGKVDILVNAAGITAEQTMVDHCDNLWGKVMDVNLHGTYRTIKLCLKEMIDHGWGRIINIASTAASVGASTSAAYCASKAAVVGLSRCVALEGAPYGVTCNTISPGWVETNFGSRWMTHIAETAEQRRGADYIEEVKAGNPQNRMIQPQEIGAIAAFLCRDDALGLTMQDITVSAGSLW